MISFYSSACLQLPRLPPAVNSIPPRAKDDHNEDLGIAFLLSSRFQWRRSCQCAIRGQLRAWSQILVLVIAPETPFCIAGGPKRGREITAKANQEFLFKQRPVKNCIEISVRFSPLSSIWPDEQSRVALIKKILLCCAVKARVFSWKVVCVMNKGSSSITKLYTANECHLAYTAWVILK